MGSTLLSIRSSILCLPNPHAASALLDFISPSYFGPAFQSFFSLGVHPVIHFIHLTSCIQAIDHLIILSCFQLSLWYRLFWLFLFFFSFLILSFMVLFSIILSMVRWATANLLSWCWWESMFLRATPILVIWLYPLSFYLGNMVFSCFSKSSCILNICSSQPWFIYQHRRKISWTFMNVLEFFMNFHERS